MDIDKLTDFFMWCTILCGGLLVFSTIFCMVLRNFIGRMHAKLFGVSPEAVKIAIYAFIAGYKILFIIFCLAPYIALVIIR